MEGGREGDIINYLFYLVNRYIENKNCILKRFNNLFIEIRY